jgi:hypothetical protein
MRSPNGRAFESEIGGRLIGAAVGLAILGCQSSPPAPLPIAPPVGEMNGLACVAYVPDPDRLGYDEGYFTNSTGCPPTAPNCADYSQPTDPPKDEKADLTRGRPSLAAL